MNVGATINSTAADSSRRSQRTVTGCSSPAPPPRRVRRRRPLPVLPRGHPRRFRLADADQPRPERQHRRRTRTATATSTTEASRSCSSAATGSAPPGAPTCTEHLRRTAPGAGDADSGAQQPATENRPDPPPGRAGDLLLLRSTRGIGSHRHLDRDASHRRRRLVDAGQPRRDRE